MIRAARLLVIFLFSWSAAADVVDRLQGATALLTSTTPLVDGQLPDDATLWTGTAFLARFHGETIWFTAAHVTRGARSGRRRLLLFEDPSQAFESIAVGRLQGRRLVDSRLSLTSGLIDRVEIRANRAADVAWFPASGQTYKARALELRNLMREPLRAGESLYLSGVDGTEVEQRKTLACTFTNPWGAYMIFIHCPSVKVTQSGEVWAGSLSGGVVADSQGRAVAIFSGYLPTTLVSGMLHLQAALLPKAL